VNYSNSRVFSHTSILLGEYEAYLWPVVAVWCFDRPARLVRLVYCNVHIRFNRGKIFTTRTVVSYSKGADILRLEITPNSHVRPGPGQHYYLYQPRRWRGYENHPFTLGGWSLADEMDKTAVSELKAANLSNPDFGHSSDNPRVSEGPGRHSELSYKPIFWLRPLDGWTRRLRNECLQSPGNKLVGVDFLIEGPYGTRVPVHNYESIIFIAGGTGIAAALPYIGDLIQRSRISDAGKYQRYSEATPKSLSWGLLSSSGVDIQCWNRSDPTRSLSSGQPVNRPSSMKSLPKSSGQFLRNGMATCKSILDFTPRNVGLQRLQRLHLFFYLKTRSWILTLQKFISVMEDRI
jgi:hypothetical protein